MGLQLEDYVDVLKVLFQGYAFLFLFDHSCGHDRQREDGLNIEKMNKEFGRAQPPLWDTITKQKQVYLDSYPWILELGVIQSTVFKPTDDGSF